MAVAMNGSRFSFECERVLERKQQIAHTVFVLGGFLLRLLSLSIQLVLLRSGLFWGLD